MQRKLSLPGIHYLKTHWFIILVIIAFIILKVPHLSYPFLWDESYPYAKAVHEMYQNGPSLHPSVIDDEYSKGHPLLFHFLAASWMKVFGDSNFVMHSFSLFIATLLIICVFTVVKQLFSKRAAHIAVLLLLTQVTFFVQSSFLQPEVMVAFWIFLSVYFYAAGWFIPLFLTLTALFFTKESGFVLGVVLGFDSIINLLNRKESLKSRITRVIVLLLSLLPIGLFFYIQYRTKGWMFFPGHTGLFRFEWEFFGPKFTSALKILFVEDPRYCLFIFLLLIATIHAIIKRKPVFPLMLAIPMVFGYIIVTEKLPAHSKWWTFLFTISFLLPVYLFGYSDAVCKQNKAARRFIILSLHLAIGYTIFTATNFYTSRYLVPVIVMLLIPTGIIMAALLDKIHTKAYYLGIPAILVLGAWGYYKDTGYGDIDLGAFDAMDVQQGMVDYLEGHNYYHKKISSNSFLQRIHLIDPATGFLRSSKVFTDVQWDVVKETDIAVFDNLEHDYQREWVVNDTSYQLVYKIEKGDAWGEIYMKKLKITSTPY